MGAIFWAVIIVGAIGVAAQSLPKSTKPVEQSKISQENYDKILVGMTFREVEDILGKEWNELSTVGSMQTYRWGSIFSGITISLNSNRVYAKTPHNLR